jgi:hypothetical protein
MSRTGIAIFQHNSSVPFGTLHKQFIAWPYIMHATATVTFYMNVHDWFTSQFSISAAKHFRNFCIVNMIYITLKTNLGLYVTQHSTVGNRIPEHQNHLSSDNFHTSDFMEGSTLRQGML